MRHVPEDIDQDGDGVRGMFVREVDGQFGESDVALYSCSRLSQGLISYHSFSGREERELAYHEHSFFLFPLVLFILCELVASLNVRSNKVNSRR